MADEPMNAEEREFLGIGEDERLHPILSNEEVLEARAKARKRLEKERKAAAMADVEAREVQRLRIEEGLTTGIGDEDRIVWITVDLPAVAPWIAVNGEPYWHSHSYPVTVAQLRSLQEQMQNAWRAEDQMEGKSIVQTMQTKRASTIHGKTGIVDNAPRRFDA